MAREMKDSGVEWIGKIPREWEVLKNKNCFTLRKEIVGNSFEEYNLLSLTKLGIKIKDKNDFKGKVPENYGTYQNVKRGEIVLCLFDLDCSAVFSGLSEYEGMISPAYKVYTCNKNIYNTFAKYWFEYCFIERKYKIYSKSLRYVVNSDDFGGIEILVPPLEEQEKIANYLDKKVSDIDLIIEKTKITIEDYKKYKQSIITEVVAKGLNPNVEMKDSGNIYIGKIPKKWQMKKIKYLFLIKKDIAGKIGFDILSITQKGIKIKDTTTNEGQMSMDYSKYQLLNVGEFAMNHMDLLTGWVDISKYDGVTSPDYRVFKLIDEKNNSKNYYLYFMQICYSNKIFYSLGQGVSSLGRWRLQSDKFMNFIIPVPPLEEQNQIAEYLDKKTSEIDTLINKKEALIKELEEYKKSLIYECVTGKKEIK